MLHYIETGTGPAVVLLHAFPVDSALWASQRRPLGTAGFRVITPDLPGFGGSPLSPLAPSLDVMADEVVATMDGLGVERAIVGGLSMGGYVVMAMLRRHPDRMAGIVLADTKGGLDPAPAIANRWAMADAVQAAGRAQVIADAMIPNLLGTTTRAERGEVETAVRRWIGAQRAGAIAWAQRAMAVRPDSLPDIAAFGGPVLVLYGDEDVLSPASEAALMAEAARSGGSPTQVVEIPRSGHLTAVENPDAVVHALSSWLPGAVGHSGLA